jgi:transposase-like protein
MSLNLKQIEAVELFATTDRTCQDIAIQLDVSPNTLSNWRRDYEFNEEVLKRARTLLRCELPAVYRVLLKNAKEGKITHIQTLLNHLERLESILEASRRGNIAFLWDIEDAPAGTD